eukprot:1196360-Prorocentrum_minimum.AAC.3
MGRAASHVTLECALQTHPQGGEQECLRGGLILREQEEKKKSTLPELGGRSAIPPTLSGWGPLLRGPHP